MDKGFAGHQIHARVHIVLLIQTGITRLNRIFRKIHPNMADMDHRQDGIDISHFGPTT